MNKNRFNFTPDLETIMRYDETLKYLYSRTPAFHQVGDAAYKPGLERTLTLDALAGNPHQYYRTIHIAGTNGKGSVAHLLAAILREAKYKVGLYTSPHLVDFRERIRFNGRKIPEQYVTDYVDRYIKTIEYIKPSFYEVVSSMAFEFFRHKKVDFAIIETGLGGRLDSTNIIQPIMSIITNISSDHTQYLGKTLTQIAHEKAGIIKPYIPVMIGKTCNYDIRQVFVDKTNTMKSPVYFAESENTILEAKQMENGTWEFQTADYGTLVGEWGGYVQKENAETVLAALRLLKSMRIKIPVKAVRNAFENVTKLTGLMGRWYTVHTLPLVICDTGHNSGAWEYLKEQIQHTAKNYSTLRMVVGMVSDKDIDRILSLMPIDAVYYFTQPSVKRAKSAVQLAEAAKHYHLEGQCFDNVPAAVNAALSESSPDDMIFIGGSNFVVADALPLFPDALLD